MFSVLLESEDSKANAVREEKKHRLCEEQPYLQGKKENWVLTIADGSGKELLIYMC